MNNAAKKPVSVEERAQLRPWMLPGTALEWNTDEPRLVDLADRFEPISLVEMDTVALLNRIDTKFLMTAAQLLTALEALQEQYWILSINGKHLNHYRTLYFDTADFALYNLHVNGRAERYKVRSREYTDTGLAFLEVKRKTRKDRTIKERIPTDRPLTRMDWESERWLQGVYPYNSRALEPKLWNTFTRITLVSKANCERVTLDVDLAFFTAARLARLDGVVVAEVKMDARDCRSPFLDQMHAQRIRPDGFSKYCIGVALLYRQVKRNLMLPRLLKIERISGGISHE